MQRRTWLLLLGAPAALWVVRRNLLPAPKPATSILDFIGDQAPSSLFSRVTGARPFSFPADHAAHPDYRHEWWYFTGNLQDSAGRQFGFQLTFFRFALTALEPTARSAWATRHALLGHFALTDVDAQRFHAFQRLVRPVLELAGTTQRPVSIWIKNWRATLEEIPAPHWTLEAAEGFQKLALTLKPAKPYVPQGDAGYSRKSAGPGNASYYYSNTRLLAEGWLELQGTRLAVTGQAWLDREWGTNALAGEILGWDWFGLQLSDGTELTLYLLRRHDGTWTSFSAGSWVGSEGKVTQLSADDFSVRVKNHWRSKQTYVTYPAAWQIEIPRLHCELEIAPLFEAQEWTSPFRYWEGNVKIKGTRDGHPLGGVGYVELTGY